VHEAICGLQEAKNQLPLLNNLGFGGSNNDAHILCL